ncbi:MAG: dUTP diphosphatase [Clostridia bacterium]|nr:dUTP diphosphatase [Clostridia bacterium]
MEKLQIKVKKLKNDAKIPTYGSEFAAGADVYACLEESVVIKPYETKFIPTGLSFEFPAGVACLLYARSGLSCKQGLAPANKVGVIDADYRGEVMVALHNHSEEVRTVQNGDRVAQVVFTPYYAGVFEEVCQLEDSARGAGGFGSTGKA